MKVGLISFHSFLESGGVKTHLFGLSKELEKKKVRVKIIVPRRDLNERYSKNVILLGTSIPVNLGGGMTDLVFNFAPGTIETTLIKEKFDVLHFHNASIPSFFQILLSPLSFKTLNILSLHSDISRMGFLKKIPQLFEFFIKFCNWRIDGAIAVSKLPFEALKDFKGPKIIIPNGIDLERFNPSLPKIKKLRDGKINLLFVGRIEKRKGLIYLLKAFYFLRKKYKNLRLIVVGEGPERERCEKFVKQHAIPDVMFLGQIENELPRIYVSCDIFVAPSIFGESFGIIILEAMASRLPVAGFANEGFKGVLEGKKGEKFLVKPKDYKALAKKIEVLINNKNLREEMGKWGEKEAVKYSWERISERVLRFYQYCKKLKKSKTI
jgi:phosphatidylinositol alpha-mannosyltransferase